MDRGYRAGDVDAVRLWESLMTLATIGATETGGVSRLALTDAERRARDLLVRWCRAAGLAVRVDAVGNVFARRAGRDARRAPVLVGGHLDTQADAAPFDGAYGVAAALEAVRAMNDAGIETAAPVELVAWTNEEGTRFAPAMMGSMTWAGLLALDDAHGAIDADGRLFVSELARIGYQGDALPREPVDAYFEAHVEQGPRLAEQGATIGVATGAQGQCWYDLVLTGRSGHAGSTPMQARRDALAGAARVVLAVEAIGRAHPPGGCATVGCLRVAPNSRNLVPGEVAMTIEVRHPVDAHRQAMDRAVRLAVREAAEAVGLQARLGLVLEQPAARFDDACVAAVRAAAGARNLSSTEFVSGAAHDAVAVARRAPAAMVFVPRLPPAGGPDTEAAAARLLAAGCQVLLDAVRARAG